MTTLFPFHRSRDSRFELCSQALRIIKKKNTSYSLELAMTLHPTSEVDSAHKRGSKVEDLERWNSLR